MIASNRFYKFQYKMDTKWYLRKQIADIYQPIKEEGIILVDILEAWKYLDSEDYNYIHGHIAIFNMYKSRIHHELLFGAWKSALRAMQYMKKEIYAMRMIISNIICKQSIKQIYPVLFYTPRTGRVPNITELLPTHRKAVMPPLRFYGKK